MFIKPMLAASMPKGQVQLKHTPQGTELVFPPSFKLTDLVPGDAAVEEKYDGHRIEVEVTEVMGDLIPIKNVTAWSRDGLRRALPYHLVQALIQLPVGIYDGELHIVGGKSFGVTELTKVDQLVYTVFDLLELLGTPVTHETYDQRRAYLDVIFGSSKIAPCLRLSESYPLKSLDQIQEMFNQVRAKGGEGLIIKRRASRYSPDKRPKQDWTKIKPLYSAVLTVIGFEATRGEIMNRGLYAMVKLQDDEGFQTSVKTLNNKELAKFEAEAPKLVERTTEFEGMSLFEASDKAGVMAQTLHPAIGRKLRIDYTERTADGSYREPRWDRWEDE